MKGPESLAWKVFLPAGLVPEAAPILLVLSDSDEASGDLRKKPRLHHIRKVGLHLKEEKKGGGKKSNDTASSTFQ